MADTNLRAGGCYPIEELVRLARRGLEGITQTQAAEELNRRFTPQRGEFHQTQISMALRDPEKYPGMIRMLIEAFTDYDVEGPLYRLHRKK